MAALEETGVRSIGKEVEPGGRENIKAREAMLRVRREGQPRPMRSSPRAPHQL